MDFEYIEIPQDRNMLVHLSTDTAFGWSKYLLSHGLLSVIGPKTENKLSFFCFHPLPMSLLLSWSGFVCRSVRLTAISFSRLSLQLFWLPFTFTNMLDAFIYICGLYQRLLNFRFPYFIRWLISKMLSHKHTNYLQTKLPAASKKYHTTKKKFNTFLLLLSELRLVEFF